MATDFAEGVGMRERAHFFRWVRDFLSAATRKAAALEGGEGIEAQIWLMVSPQGRELA